MENRICQNCKTSFTIEPDDFSFYEKMKVPPPTFCPDCRRQRRFSWRNFVNLYKSTCALTDKPIISLYPPESKTTVYSVQAWHSDAWDARTYARDYDFSRSFFEQYVELVNEVPKPALDTDDGLFSVNCQYTNDFAMGKDCYLVVKAWKLENCMYSFYVVSSKDLVDVYTSFGKDEGNYETVNTEHCYQCRYVYDCRSCSDSAFCYDCRNCDHCFMSTGLRGKSYYFKNEEVGKERYEELMKEYALHTYSGVERAKREFEPIYKAHPRKALRMVNCVDSVGDLLFNCRNCKYTILALDSENYKYGTFSDGTKDAYDTEAGGGSELLYETDFAHPSSNIIGSFWAFACQNSQYMRHTYRCKDCFGCAGLKDAQYCILNKQYTKEEYFALRDKIIQHMNDMPYIDSKGNKHHYADFLPMELSPFPYNDSAADWIQPLNKEATQAAGLWYREPTQQEYEGRIVQADELPDSIHDVTDDVLNLIIVSKSSNKHFKITAQELAFYRKYKIPLPRESFFERHARRHKIATSYHLYERTSDKTGKPILSSYPPDAPETVWDIDEYKAEFE